MNDYVYANDFSYDTDAFVYTCGYETCAPHHSNGPIMRNSYLIHYILSGKGIYKIEGKTYHLKAGDAFLIIPNKVIYYEADENDPWTYTWIGMQGIRVHDFLQRTQFASHYILHIGDDQEIKACQEQLYTTNTLEKDKDLMLTSILYRYLFLLCEKYPCTHQNSQEKQKSYITQALRYIETHYDKNISIQSIADELHIERTYLFRLFKDHLHLSPKEYLLECRLKRAKHLLATTQEPIQVIALSVGYEDALYFSRLFKSSCHLTPTQYRKQHTNLKRAA